MNADYIVFIGILFFYLGYKYYSKYLSVKIFKLDPNFVTPAHRFEDGIVYVPTSRFVLFGHHFTSVAGAAPIVGPTIAVYWGWLPALLWIVLGTIFAAGIHDFGAIVISVRNEGSSMGALADKVIGKRAKILFLFIILVLLFMVNAVFAWVISKLFISFPSSVFPVMIQIPVAMWIGWWVYKKKGGILVPSIIGLFIMYGAAIASSSSEFLSIDLVSMFGKDNIIMGLNETELAFFTWIIFLMIYGYIASVMPVWKLLQPRDFINSHQLIIGLIILYAGVFVLSPEISAPAFQPSTDVSWFPLLFITIACGAISGFHGLVSSGTTSKQLNKETDARFVGYLGSIGEGALALISLISVITFFATREEFLTKYNSFAAASGQGLGIFVEGAGLLASAVGIPMEIGKTIVAVIVISFAATSLDTAMRLMRYIIHELGHEYKISILSKTHVATSIGIGGSALLALIPEGPLGFGSGGFLLWPLFGTGNQLLAGITLMILTIWLKKTGKNYIPALIPMVFLLAMTVYAMVQQIFFDWAGKPDKWLLLLFGSIILGFSIWIVLEGIRAIIVMRNEKNQTI